MGYKEAVRIDESVYNFLLMVAEHGLAVCIAPNNRRAASFRYKLTETMFVSGLRRVVRTSVQGDKVLCWLCTSFDGAKMCTPEIKNAAATAPHIKLEEMEDPDVAKRLIDKNLRKRYHLTSEDAKLIAANRMRRLGFVTEERYQDMLARIFKRNPYRKEVDTGSG